jgi:hypothetical protein
MKKNGTEPTYVAKLVWNETWSSAVDEAVSRAKAWFPEAHHERINKAYRIVQEERIMILRSKDAVVESDENDGGIYFIQKGHCNCPDAEYRSPWCKHTIARAIIIRARELMETS